MKLTFELFGYHIGSITLELSDVQVTNSMIDKPIKATSRWWVGRLVK